MLQREEGKIIKFLTQLKLLCASAAGIWVLKPDFLYHLYIMVFDIVFFFIDTKKDMLARKKANLS